MRFLHTADWHLGRLFHQVHLTEDQDHVLRQFVEVARDARVDAVVVAGDVYDRAVPPPEAVRLLDDVLAELLLGLKVPVIVAAGNHDSPERLAFGSRIVSAQGLHLFGLPAPDSRPVVLSDEHGPVRFYVAPYAEPALVRERLDDADALDHDSAMGAVISSMLAAHPPDGRAVFVGHAFVQGGTGSDSERPLSVGGAGTVSASHFAPFCYAALGHLHRPQAMAEGRVRYAGALLKYSFDEIGQDRSVTIVDIDASGRCSVEAVVLHPRRELRRIAGTLEELMNGGGALAPVSPASGGDPTPSRDDYIVARLADPCPVLAPIGRLRRIYPNVLCIERALSSLQPGGLHPSRDRRQLDHDQLFAGFFSEMTGQPPTDDEKDVFRSADAVVAGRDREVTA
jgi:exonuclease SbcD